jgi:hypothetical protein
MKRKYGSASDLKGSEAIWLDPEAQRLLALFPVDEPGLNAYIERCYVPGDQWMLKEAVGGIRKGLRWVSHMKPGV